MTLYSFNCVSRHCFSQSIYIYGVDLGKKIKILHFSDIHVHCNMRNLRWTEFLNKRSIGAVNLLRGRSKHFTFTKNKVDALYEFQKSHEVDILINTGDYTSLGTSEEIQVAKSLINPMLTSGKPYVTVPGNHDVYVNNKSFYQYFGDTLVSDLPEYCHDGHWPLVRLVNRELAVIAVNSARPNKLPWDSRGEVSTLQLNALAQLAKDDRIKNRFVLIVTHYAPILENSKVDKYFHSLRNTEDFLSKCGGFKNATILCGHIHYPYHTKYNETNIYCAGSATKHGKESFWLYEISNNKLESYKGFWNGNEFLLTTVQ